VPKNLNPRSETSAIILTSTGSAALVAAACPFGAYTGSVDFLSGAAAQVAYTYKKLGGDVLDIELTPANVYSAYEEAVLEYSYIINLHQSKNVLSDVLGDATGTFNHQGVRLSGPESGSLRYPRFQFQYSRRIGDGMAAAGGFGGTIPEYSASFTPSNNKQDYDLQEIVQSASAAGVDDQGNHVAFSGSVGSKRIIVTKVYFRSPRAMWRFYGYYGGVGVVGNYSTYGQFADDSTFEIIPTWQNKMQAIMYEDSIYTRTSHYAYELINNKLRLYPNPSYWDNTLAKIWVRFYVDGNAWDEDDNYETGVKGINNMNTIPFENIPFKNINSIGKQWIRKYCLALCKEMLGQIRGKFSQVPIPGQSITLNHSELLSQAKEEQTALREKLIEMLKEMEYTALAKQDSEKAEAATTTLKGSPLPIFVG
tara:strand:+ start:964 stop:2232 length:1269 start_codon:yes stop_codon:yes gene_type:complete